MNTHTLKQAGYAYVMYNPESGLHTLYEISTGNFERYASSKYFTGYALKYKNTHLEFCSSYNEMQKARMLRYMQRVQTFGEQNAEFTSTLMNVYRKYIAK